jgi:catechol 2,3-dioxygenase-like lactoylglutathione lyase family enzyme
LSTITPTLVRGIPVLPTTDLAATTRFYRDVLGFTVIATYDGYLVVERDDVRLHFWLTTDVGLADETACRIDVTAIDALYAEMNAKGVVHPAGHLTAQPWGMTEFHVFDNAGNDLRFQERTAQ